MIRIELPYLPPSSNHAYLTDSWGKRVLSAKGRKFKNETKTHVAKYYRKELLTLRPNKPYAILLCLYFSHIENKGWPNKSKSRYKIIDATNRIKLVEDAIALATGIDDSNTMAFMVHKEVGTPERTIINIWSLEDEECVIYELAKYTGSPNF